MKGKYIIIILMLFFLPSYIFSISGEIIQLNSDKSILAKLKYDPEIQRGGILTDIKTGLQFSITDLYGSAKFGKIIVQANAIDTGKFDFISINDSVSYKAPNERARNLSYNARKRKMLKIIVLPFQNDSIGVGSAGYGLVLDYALRRFLSEYKNIELLKQKTIEKIFGIYAHGKRLTGHSKFNIHRTFGTLNPDYIVVPDYTIKGGKIYISIDIKDFISGKTLNRISNPGNNIENFYLVVQFALNSLKTQFKLKLNDLIKYRRSIIVSRNTNALIDFYKGLKFKREFNMFGEQKEMKSALKSDPTIADAYKEIGLVLQKQGFYDEAEEYYKKALEYDENFAEVYFNLGVIYYRRGWYNEAITQYKKALSVNPGMYISYYNQGLSYKALQSPKKAEMMFKRYNNYGKSEIWKQNAHTEIQQIKKAENLQ